MSISPGYPRVRVRAVLTTLLGLGLISGCASTATVEAAPDAANPDCADVMLMVPEVLGDHELRPTTSQGTAVWGDPSQVVMRCGVVPPGPSAEHCVGADGVDWLALEEDEQTWRLVTYGRDPAVEVLLNLDEVGSSTAMLGLAPAVQQVEQTRACTTLDQEIEETEDAQEVQEGAATEPQD
ncbi:DUF3515 domain-containing protein [Nesterenkonia sp. LB17]|uniref:DUF3515 family protein n=1 Tax=unclassified Nesterenkonia TaxID=2629769 RepID=UPI001F4C65F7|nr:DUF3515 domain-containing protein [Nesterenkonia sp. DZ6]MCH8564852.1 DUF3515 domain-containing protein [Nesterenkonia sp. LB17]MCH8570468.1 DUF3515 domain-containing protein [Nesterenkonia sp. AY15]